MTLKQTIICYAIHETERKSKKNTYYYFMLHTCLCLSLKMVYRSFPREGILLVWVEQHLQILPIMHIIHQK